MVLPRRRRRRKRVCTRDKCILCILIVVNVGIATFVYRNFIRAGKSGVHDAGGTSLQQWHDARRAGDAGADKGEIIAISGCAPNLKSRLAQIKLRAGELRDLSATAQGKAGPAKKAGADPTSTVGGTRREKVS